MCISNVLVSQLVEWEVHTNKHYVNVPDIDISEARWT